MENNFAPIILFTYRRNPCKTIETLLQNPLAIKSNLYIFSDGYKDNSDKQDVISVRKYLETIEGFQSIKIYKVNENKGLANSIIHGVTTIINKYNRAIVLEDDLLVSKDFLSYMNDALMFYKNNQKIWSISGYSPQLPVLKDKRQGIYLAPRGSSWGWGTWKDRWSCVDWNAESFYILKYNKKMRKDFELAGNDMYKMLELQMLGKLDSWAIRWCFSEFLQNKYTIYPYKSKIVNNGFNDQIGTHNNGLGNKWKVVLNHEKINFSNIEPNEGILKSFKSYYDLSLYTKIGYILKKYGGYNFMKKILFVLGKI